MGQSLVSTQMLRRLLTRGERGRSSADRAANTAMREQTYPPPYPDAWYRVASSKELRRGKTLFRECLGTQIVLFRSDLDDSVTAMGAYCPHLGANLAQGRVLEGQIECPFHQWRFDSDGSVASIPYTDRKPSKPCVRTWTVVERYGQLFVYHRSSDSKARPPEPPPYPFAKIDDIDDGRFVYRGSYDAGRVHMHISEFAENSVDFQHFGPVHGRMFVPWTTVPVPGVVVHHEGKWSIDEQRQHIVYFRNRAILEILGRKVERSRGDAELTYYGPGSLVIFRFTIPGAGELVIFHSHLPIRAMEQQVDFHWYADKNMPRWLVFYIVGNWISQWRGDVSIWENKIFLRKPLLVQGDGPVHELRKWFKQFYSSPET